ncbi:MAG: hypothetical protein ABIS18_00720 [Actinomycetota bacterium]
MINGAVPLLTIFGIPKAFSGHTGVIQRNAITSWTLLRPKPYIVLFGADSGTAELANELDIQHEPAVLRTKHGTPLVNDMFERAERLTDTPILCYVNADIILPRILVPVLEQVRRYKDAFLISGERWDLDITGSIDFSDPKWEANLVQDVLERGRPLGKGGMDYFVYTRGLFGEMPPFAVGRTAWDNWLLYAALRKRVPLIDASQVVQAVHQNHDYSHAGGTEMAWKGPEANLNLALAGSRIFNLEHATHVVRPDGIYRTLTLRNSPYRLWDYIYLSGRLSFLKPFLMGGKRLLDLIRGRQC